MLSLYGWLFALTAASFATILAAAADQPAVHMTTVAVVAATISVLAARERLALENTGAPTSAVASSTARHLALVWAWGAVSIIVTYLFVIEKRWPEWWQFFLGFTVAAAASIAYSALLDRDRIAGRDDTVLVKAGRILLQFQIVAMAAGLISLFIDAKFPRAATHADWAGCNIFFFGALAIAAISMDALRSRTSV
jgi:hypothetical protein